MAAIIDNYIKFLMAFQDFLKKIFIGLITNMDMKSMRPHALA